MDRKRIRLYDIKRTKGKGEAKMRDCLGPGCDIKFVTTPDTRLCDKCKRNVEKIEDDVSYPVAFNNRRGGKE